MHEETKALKIKSADCQKKPTCFNHQHFDPCKRSTPPPTPMLVSLHLRDGDIRQKSQSQLNNARSSSWPAHLHGDNWQRTLIFSERYVDVLLLFRSCFCTRPFSMVWNVFWVGRRPTALCSFSKPFTTLRCEFSICMQNVFGVCRNPDL